MEYFRNLSFSAFSTVLRSILELCSWMIYHIKQKFRDRYIDHSIEQFLIDSDARPTIMDI